VEQRGIDLLIAGALEKESILRHFLGSVARTLVREAPCSVMLFTNPDVEPKPIRNIVVIVDFSSTLRAALDQALYLAEREKSECVRVVRIHTPFAQARAAARGKRMTRDGEEARLAEFVRA